MPMTNWREGTPGGLGWLRGSRGLWAVAIVVVLLAALWLMPRRVARLVTVDGQDVGPAPAGTPMRQVAWKQAEPIEIEADRDDETADLIAPRLAGDGQLLYLTRRGPDGRMDIFRSRRSESGWEKAEPVDELNSPANDIGPVISADGQTLYFFSNRDGGHGGYDLYTSRRDAAGWDAPRNLGESVNSVANEFDPALSPDGMHLFFSSDRETADGNQLPQWTATIRRPLTGHDFDLYEASRGSSGAPFSSVRPLDVLNRSGSHEGAPFVSPDGGFLYFASNRVARAGEPTNLDLYRARWTDNEFGAPQNLGPMINTENDETEPGVSAEGFRLVFATNRDGRDRLYRSVAREIELQQGWDSSRFDSVWLAVGDQWGRALWITLLVAGLVALVLWSRGWLWRRATASRFVFGSVVFHLLVVLSLFLWKLDSVVEVIAEVVQDWEASTDLVDDNQHKSQEDGPESYEKVDELQSLDDAATPEVTRQVTEALSVPVRTESLLPQVPLRQVQSLPPEMVLRVAPKAAPRETPTNPLEPLERRRRTQPDSTVAMIETPVDATLPPAEAVVQEKRVRVEAAAVQRQAKSVSRRVPRRTRAATPAPATASPKEVPVAKTPEVASDAPREVRIARENRVASATAVPAAVVGTAETPEAAQAPREQRLQVANGSLPREATTVQKQGATGRLVDRPAPRMSEAAQTDQALRAVAATPQLPTAPPRRKVSSTRSRLVASRTAAGVESDVVLDKQSTAKSTAENGVQVADATLSRNVPRRRRRVEAPTAGLGPDDPQPAATTGAEIEAAEAVANSVTGGPATVRSVGRRRRPVTRTTDTAAGAEVQNVTPAAERSVDLGNLLATNRVLDRKPASATVNLRTPREMTGPIRRVPDRVIIGDPGQVDNNKTPDFGPLVSRLDRRRARASRVALGEDNIGLRALFTLRQGDTRRKYIKLFGGSDESEEAVNRGLVWLAAHQFQKGNWSLDRFHERCKGQHPNCTGLGRVRSNTAATGMALMPFLAAGHTHRSGRHQQVVARGVKWLIDQQKSNGDLLSDGDSAHAHMYSHGIASIALCEAYGMTEDPKLRSAAEKAINFIVQAQNTSTGGWRYKPGESGDTSVVGWQMMALKSAEMAGLVIPPKTITLLDKWLRRVEANQPVGGLFGYTDRGVKPAMTAEGLLCLQFMGVDRNDPRMRAGADYLLKNLPSRSQQRTSYYWYYATQVMYHMQGKYWLAWNEPLRKTLVATQQAGGHMAGTWNPADNWENQGGRIYATAMKLLVLEVYYRHLPLYDQLDDE
ncbi:MAG: hypothetical protein CMJ68_14590 [Planctomycetaceae bacterium]|nr:hypothetical protein [Planctomycetaceae bacterium]